jgi:hypothetical protein
MSPARALARSEPARFASLCRFCGGEYRHAMISCCCGRFAETRSIVAREVVDHAGTATGW